MFKETLKEVVDNTHGGIAALLMGLDGITLEQYNQDGTAEIDIESVGMEFSVILKEILRATQALGAEAAREITIKAERATTIIRLINDEFFVAMTLRPEGNFGKGRFLLRTRAQKILESLS